MGGGPFLRDIRVRPPLLPRGRDGRGGGVSAGHRGGGTPVFRGGNGCPRSGGPRAWVIRPVGTEPHGTWAWPARRTRRRVPARRVPARRCSSTSGRARRD